MLLQVLVLSPGAQYPLLCIAGIKLLQGQPREAVEDYRILQVARRFHCVLTVSRSVQLTTCLP